MRPVLVALVAALVAAGGPSPIASGGVGPPNIVLILTDDQRWDTLWAMPYVQDLLVAHGVSFTSSFVVNPLCCPARASILTGRYSHSTGVYSNKTGFSDFDDASTVATWLEGAGYRTGLVGKYLNGYDQVDATYVPPGWDRWVAFTSQTGQGMYYDYDVSVDGVNTHYGSDPGDYSTDVLASYATDFIDTTPAGTPLFLYFSVKAPHFPAVPGPNHQTEFSDLPPWRPPSWNEPDVSDKPGWVQALPPLSTHDIDVIDGRRVDQYRTLLSVDDAVAGIVDALTAAGRMSNTMLVFASDNGWLWGEHRWDGKKVPWEESIRVPLVVRYDPMTPTPRLENRMALNIDLAPTFAALAGVPAPGAVGRSLLPVLPGGQVAWRSDFLVENSVNSGGEDEVPTYCAVRNKTYLYVRYLATGEEELYPIKADPYELDNKALDPGYASALAQLRLRSQKLCRPLPPLVVSGQPGD
jgi:arylsulfatase A-like enzyme